MEEDIFKKINNIDITDSDNIIQTLEDRAGNIPDRNLNRMKTALKFFDIKPKKIVNIVGTNGKGTVSNGIFSILKSFGLKTGLYTSPHLVRYTERIRDCDGEIPYDLFLKLVKYVSSFEDEIDCGKFTYFEVITISAMIFFELKNEDILIVEAGVGGRYDATKAIEESFLQVITSISIDHADYLGNTISEIAKNKAGIMNGSSTLTLNDGDALSELKKESVITKTNLITKDEFSFYINNTEVNKEDLPVSGPFKVKFSEFEIEINPKQFGVFRGENYALVFAASILILKHMGIQVDVDIIKTAINAANWEGRTEVIGNNPLTILDGAHNEDAIKKLFKSAFSLKKNKVISVFAIMSRKDHEHIAPIIRNNSDFLIVTTNGDKKSVNVNVLKNETKADIALNDLNEALNYAKKISKPNDLILIFGSLYLVGEILKIIK